LSFWLVQNPSSYPITSVVLNKEGFPTSGNDRSQRGRIPDNRDRSQRAWTSCPFWLSLSSIVKNRQDPSSPCHSGLSRILLLIRSHLSYSTKKDSRQAGMTDHRGEGFPTIGTDHRGHGPLVHSGLACPRLSRIDRILLLLVILACPESFFLSDHICRTQQRRIPDKRE